MMPDTKSKLIKYCLVYLYIICIVNLAIEAKGFFSVAIMLF